MTTHRYNLRSSLKLRKKKTMKKKTSMTFAEQKEWAKLLKAIADDVPSPQKIIKSNVPENIKKRAGKMLLSYMYDENTLMDKFDIAELIDELINPNKNDPASVSLDAEFTRLNTMAQQTSMKGVDAYRKKILDLNANDNVKIELLKKVNELTSHVDNTSESAVSLVNYLNWALSLPYRTRREIKIPSNKDEFKEWFNEAMKKFDGMLYGMKNVKEELLLAAASRFACPTSVVSLGLAGPPGVGKTAIVSAFAEIVGLPFERISLGGLQDPSIFKGQHKHWVGSGPGIILEIMSRFKCSNGIILLDEIDKLSDSPHGAAIENALLHVTDYTQNSEYQDMYLSDFTHDISGLWFVYSLNDASKIDHVLLDRLKLVDVKGYSNDELKIIITNHLLPRSLKKTGLTENDIKFTPDALSFILKTYETSSSKTNGVRAIERMINSIVSRINFLRMSPNDVSKKMSFYIPDISLPIELSQTHLEKIVEKPAPKEQLTYFL